MAKGHVHLNPVPPGQKKMFWLFVGVSITFIVVGWVLSTKASLSHEFSQVKDQVSGSIEQAADRFEEVEALKEVTGEDSRTFNEAVEEAIAAYEEITAEAENENQENQ